jgi:Ni,Fe-hydrogenase III large subunit
MKTGARQRTLSGLCKLAASAMARDLCVFVIPGPEIARACDLDLEAAGLRLVASPRHASVLLVVGNISAALRDAASVVYAQMMRPRALLFLGAEELSPLPVADVKTGLSQQGLVEGVHQLRKIFAQSAFRTDIEDFDAPSLNIKIEYVCPMHPEVVQDEPGNCPKCGMDLMPRETQADSGSSHTTHDKTGTPAVMQASSSTHHHMHHDHKKEDTDPTQYTCPMHPEVVQDGPGSCPKCGMHLVPKEEKSEHGHAHHHMHHDHKKEDAAPTQYTCPMHPEVVQDGPGSCPKCGMDLVPRNGQEKTESTHSCCQNKEREAPTQYTCPMHPEVVQDGPGSCPKCGMHLVPKEEKSEHDHGHHHMHHDHKKEDAAPTQYTCPMHPEVVQDGPGSCPKCGMHLVPKEEKSEHDHAHHHMHHDHKKEDADPTQYTCPMHPEVVQDGPGSCPKCGMFLVPKEGESASTHEHAKMDHDNMDHDSMDHGDMGFMSMIDVTKDLPRSSDDLPMEWIEAPFGPFFPGLASGLLLTFTLDGDTVAGSNAHSVTGKMDLLQHSPVKAESFVAHLASLEPLAPIAYRLLACLALENAGKVDVPADIARARVGALERERIASHLSWLALFGEQTGFNWLMRRAASLQLKIQHAPWQELMALKPALKTLMKRLPRTPLLKSRTVGIGYLEPQDALRGPVARAAGIVADARSTDENWTALGFTASSRIKSDAFARLQVRLDDIAQSLALIEAAGAIAKPELVSIGKSSAKGETSVETARGLASLSLTVKSGTVIAATLETPSTHHLDLIEPLSEQQELGDALVAIGSLDLSPWEMQQ